MKLRGRAEIRRAGLAKLGHHTRMIYNVMGIELTNQKLREHLQPKSKKTPPGWYSDTAEEGARASATLDHLERKLLAAHPELTGRIERPGYEADQWQERMRILPAGDRGSPIEIVHDHLSELTIGFEWWHEHVDVRDEAQMMKLIERMMRDEFVIRDLIDEEGHWHQSGPEPSPETVEAHPEWTTRLVSFTGKHARVIPPIQPPASGQP